MRTSSLQPQQETSTSLVITRPLSMGLIVANAFLILPKAFASSITSGITI